MTARWTAWLAAVSIAALIVGITGNPAAVPVGLGIQLLTLIAVRARS